jgi:hypothetical protein
LYVDQTIKRADFSDRPLVDLAGDALMDRFRELWENVKSRVTEARAATPAQPLRHGS